MEVRVKQIKSEKTLELRLLDDEGNEINAENPAYAGDSLEAIYYTIYMGVATINELASKYEKESKSEEVATEELASCCGLLESHGLIVDGIAEAIKEVLNNKCKS